MPCPRATKTSPSPSTKKILFEGQVEDAFRLYAGSPYRQHNPLVEDGMDGLKKFVAWIMSKHPDARCEIKRVFADGGPCDPSQSLARSVR